MAALVSGAVLTSGLSEAWFSYRDYDAALVATQREAAALAVSRIEQFVVENERALRSAVQPLRLDPTDDLTRRHEDFRRLLRQAPALTEVTYLDGHGRERIRVSRIAVDVIGSNVDRSDEPAYRAGQAGGTYYSPVQFRDQSEPFIQIAVGDDGPSPGVTIADLNLKLIWDVVTQISSGETGSAYVVDTAGRLIAHPELELVLRQTDMSGLAQVQSVLRGGQTGATIAPDLLGRQVLSTSAVIPPLGWTVFVEQPLEMVFAPLYASLARTAVFLLVGLSLSVAAGVLLVRHMLGPIRALADGVTRVGAGALDQRIVVRTGDELEALANEFNHMSVRLQESYTTLEQKVDERTHDLAVAVHEIEQQRQELAGWNQTLEARVAEQVCELERLGRLRRFLSAQIAELVVASGDQALLESHRREVTLVACGLRGFAGFSESSAPEEVMAVLREFHVAVGEVISQFGGTLERFAGEGLFVLFNDPVPCTDPAARAVRMALEMRERTAALSGLWRQRGYELAFGAGIAMGYATLGVIGFEGRQDYAAVGSVNTQAADLYARTLPGQVLLSARVHSSVRELVQANLIEDGSNGNGIKRAPVYQLLALKSDQPTRRPPSASLTAREREVAALIARGQTNRQIAEALIVTERTVATHIEHILVKLDFASRTQIGVWAAENGLLTPAGA